MEQADREPIMNQGKKSHKVPKGLRFLFFWSTFFFAVSEIAVAFAHKIVASWATYFLLLGLEFGLALIISMFIVIIIRVASVGLARILPLSAAPWFSLVESASVLLAMPLFFSFYLLNTKALALLPPAGFERLFFNALFLILALGVLTFLAASLNWSNFLAGLFFVPEEKETKRAKPIKIVDRERPLATKTTENKNLDNRERGWRRKGGYRLAQFRPKVQLILGRLSGIFFLQALLPLVHFFFLSSRPNPVSFLGRFGFLLTLTFPLIPASGLVIWQENYLKGNKNKYSIAALVCFFLFPMLLLFLVPPFSNYERRQPSLSHQAQVKENFQPNVILIVWDTGRKDRYSLYGHFRPTTPSLDAFAVCGLVFSNAYTVAPWTLPSHASMFTGLYPSQHQADYVEGPYLAGRPLSQKAITLAEILKAQGYQGAAFSANHGLTNRSFGLDQGFDIYFDERPHVFDLLTVHLLARFDDKWLRMLGLNPFYLGSELNRRIFSWLKRKARAPFFLFINYMDPHGTNYLPPPYRGFFGAPDKRPAVPYEKIMAGEETISPKDYEALLTRYDEDLAYCDFSFGQLIAALKQLNLFDPSLIVVTSDHGQLLGEHNFFGHRQGDRFVLYEEILKIPLVIKGPPGWQPKRRPETPIENREIFFLILEELGISPPFQLPLASCDRDGVYTLAESSSTSLSSGQKTERLKRVEVAVTCHHPPQPKLIISSIGESELYFLEEDPREKRNLIKEQPGMAARLMEVWLRGEAVRQKYALPAEKSSDITRDLKERLRSLGYIK